MGGSSQPRPNAGRFTAAAPALGYLYQTRYALLMLLKGDHGTSIRLEKTDDIDLDREGPPLSEQIQVKHHKGGPPLGDAHSDLWKTLRNWSVCMREGATDPSRTKMVLATTSAAGSGTAASMLGPDGPGRDVEAALERLEGIARAGRPESNRQYYDEFERLGRDGRRRLLGSSYVLHSEEDIAGVGEAIRRELRWAAPRGKLDAFAERVEGWWHDRAIRSLREGTPIDYSDLQGIVDDLHRSFADDSLPTDYADAALPPGDMNKEWMFVRQLEMVGVERRRQIRAMRDYYRACKQRSKWYTDELLFDNELAKYDSKLRESWSDLFDSMREDLAGCSDEETLRREGKSHYNATIRMDMPIRRGVSEPYVARGSLHRLSNRLEIGWHPHYAQRLGAPARGAGAA